MVTCDEWYVLKQLRPDKHVVVANGIENGRDAKRTRDELQGDVIDDFRGLYRFLSNYHPCIVRLDGVDYPSTEHAYQAAKALDSRHRKHFLGPGITCKEARRMGQNVLLRPDWESVKVDVMRDLLRQKFDHPELRRKLMETRRERLVEGNWWGDTFWGVCNGVGENNLGKLLMEIRGT